MHACARTHTRARAHAHTHACAHARTHTPNFNSQIQNPLIQMILNMSIIHTHYMYEKTIVHNIQHITTRNTYHRNMSHTRVIFKMAFIRSGKTCLKYNGCM
jgi:hypothetical protein